MNRRALLQGLGAAGIALPFFGSIGSAIAAPAKPQKRFIAMFTANGTIPEAWQPKGTETNFQFGEILKPLDAYKKQINVIRNMAYRNLGPGGAHQKGIGQWLTGAPLSSGNFKNNCAKCPNAGWGSGISIDQHIANLLEKEAQAEKRSFKYKSLEFGVQSKNNDLLTRMIYRGPEQPVTPQENPYDTFKQIFAGAGGNQQNLEALRARRKSILDAVRGELNVLKNNLSKQDQQRLDQHLTGVREVERSVTAQTSATCKKPTLQQGLNPNSASHFHRIGKLQMQLLTTAIICGVTPVASLQWSRAVSQTKFTWLGINDGHHSLSHKPDSDGKAKAQLIKINNWYAQQFKFMLDELSQAKEANGSSVLDNTVLIWGNELGKGNNHRLSNVPLLMAGNVGNFFKTGRNVVLPDNTPHNKLLVTLAHAYGDTKRQYFNDPKFKGTLNNIKA